MKIFFSRPVIKFFGLVIEIISEIYAKKEKLNFQKLYFIKNVLNWTSIDAYYELRSNDRGVAQLGSAGALGAYLFTNETSCNN